MWNLRGAAQWHFCWAEAAFPPPPPKALPAVYRWQVLQISSSLISISSFLNSQVELCAVPWVQARDDHGRVGVGAPCAWWWMHADVSHIFCYFSLKWIMSLAICCIAFNTGRVLWLRRQQGWMHFGIADILNIAPCKIFQFDFAFTIWCEIFRHEVLEQASEAATIG